MIQNVVYLSVESENNQMMFPKTIFSYKADVFEAEKIKKYLFKNHSSDFLVCIMVRFCNRSVFFTRVVTLAFPRYRQMITACVLLLLIGAQVILRNGDVS